MTTELIELADCPFCGGKPDLYDTTLLPQIPKWRISCANRGCPADEIWVCKSMREEAITAWNTRALASRAGGWLPIESAPRDGTNILLVYCGEDSPNSVTQGYWLDAEDDGVDYMGADGGFVDVNYTVFYRGRSFGQKAYQGPGHQPTHWMPLPEPPALDSGGAGEVGGG